VKLVEHRMLVAANLRTAEGWTDQLNADNLEGLRLELRAGRKLPPIQVVETPDGFEVVKGFHRLAAHIAESLDDIRADVVEYDSADEREVDVLAENLRRRQLPIEEYRAGLRRLVSLYEVSPEDRSAVEDQLDAELGGPSEDAERNSSARADQLPTAAKPGRPASSRRKAIKRAAATTGASEDTVERALKPKDDEPEAPEPTDIPPALDWYDIEPDRDVDGQARKVQAQVDEIDKGLRAVKRLLTGLRELGHPNAICDQLEGFYAALAHEARRQEPKASCYACKGLKVLRSRCFDCQGTGYATKAMIDGDVPAELKERGGAAMVRDGRGGFRGLPNASATTPVDANGNRVLTAEEAGDKFRGAESDETPEGDPSTPYEPSAGEIVVVRWNPQGDVKRARFVRFTKSGRSMVVQIARVDRKGKVTGEWGDYRTFDRAELMGPAEGLPF
jgi:ParB-like chromosome segregation protein Spo0J